MKIYCVVDVISKKVFKIFHHKKSAITWASLHDCPAKGHLLVVKIDLDEYMNQIL